MFMWRRIKAGYSCVDLPVCWGIELSCTAT